MSLKSKLIGKGLIWLFIAGSAFGIGKGVYNAITRVDYSPYSKSAQKTVVIGGTLVSLGSLAWAGYRFRNQIKEEFRSRSRRHIYQEEQEERVA